MRRSLLRTVMLFVCSQLLQGEIINIPDDYPTIQQGIDAAVPEDTILIWPGTYIEELEINQKDLVLSSRFLSTGDTSFIDSTILDGDSTYHILTCNGPHSIQVTGLTFTHGFGYYTGANNRWWGGAITAFDTTEIDIHSNKFISNYGEMHPGINAYDSSSVMIRNTLFYQNYGARSTYIRNSRGRSTVVTGSSFIENFTSKGPFIVSVSGRYLRIDSCNFFDNHGNTEYYSTSAMCVYASDNWTEMTNCVFRNNVLSLQPGLVDLSLADTLIMRDCIFDSTIIETAQYDNGGYCYFIRLWSSNDNIYLHNIRIANNNSTNGNDFGIGIFAQANQSLIADSIFVIDNYEEFEYDKGGKPGCRLFSDGTVEASHIYVMNNTALRSDLEDHPTEHGCARYNLTVRGDVLLEHAEIAFNNNDFRQDGLGIFIDGLYPFNQSVIIRDVEIHDNSWNYQSQYAGMMGWGSGILSDLSFFDSIELDNVRIYNQQSTLLGAAMHLWADTISIRNTHISDCGHGAINLRTNSFALENLLVHDCWNTRGEPSSHIVSASITESADISNSAIVDSYGDYGAALEIWSETDEEKTVRIQNCIIENTCPNGLDLHYTPDANIDFIVQYSNIDDGWEGEGNIDVDPMFTDPENDDYTFLPDSPCIDAGNPDPAYNDPEDLNHTGWPLWPSQGTLRNDMGCYGGPGAIDLWNYQNDTIRPQSPIQPATIELSQNYPNPFNPITTIEFTLLYPQEVELTVYNILGQQVQMLADQPYSAGVHQVRFDGSGLASGVYVYRLVAGERAVARKMVLVR